MHLKILLPRGTVERVNSTLQILSPSKDEISEGLFVKKVFTPYFSSPSFTSPLTCVSVTNLFVSL